MLQRQAQDDAFTEDQDQALAELVRQVALALHNVNLDSALQASLDDVRRYAAELQESRARIVATGASERRQIERKPHDGAQQHTAALACFFQKASRISGVASSGGDWLSNFRNLAAAGRCQRRSACKKGRNSRSLLATRISSESASGLPTRYSDKAAAASARSTSLPGRSSR